MTDNHYHRFEGGQEVVADVSPKLTKATFDYTKDYEEYNKKYDSLPDDDSGIPELLADLKR